MYKLRECAAISADQGFSPTDPGSTDPANPLFCALATTSS